LTDIAPKIVPAILLAIAIRGFVRYLVFTLKGRVGHGVIVDIDTVQSGGSANFFQTITFTTETQKQVTGRIPLEVAWAFKRGEKVEVWYMPANPQKFIVRSNVTALFPIVWIALSLLLMAA
jgi:hypothetical protein